VSIRAPAPIGHDPANEQAPPAEDVTIRAPIDTMPTGSFSSSNVHSALYDFGAAELFVRYLRDGPDAIYQYDGVQPTTWEGLQNASSKGSFINENVAYSFNYTKLTQSDFPDDGRGLENDLARRFITDP